MSQQSFFIRRAAPSPFEYMDLCRSAGLSIPDKSLVQSGLNASILTVRADASDGQILGMARIVGDGSIFFEIVDVTVRREAQRNGIGWAMMENLLDWLELNASPSAFISLHANSGSAGFYEALGFRKRATDEPSMFHPHWNRTETARV